jgi:hypothetical protein
MRSGQLSRPILGASADDEVRALARLGTLSGALSSATGADRRRLIGATYAIVWPVVFSRLTRGLELRRGHTNCARGVPELEADCLDRFEDDVEAAVDDVIRHADRPIERLDAWIASRLNAATVDGHRRRRGARGALQRPRAPGWLVAALSGRPQLVDLAISMLVWVGTPRTAGTQTWPIESWAQRPEYAAASGTYEVHRDIDVVLTAMRTKPDWFERYVETPLGHKQPPVAGAVVGADGQAVDRPALALITRNDVDDASLRALAGQATDEIRRRLELGEAPHTVVRSVVWQVFGADGPDSGQEYDRAPHTTPAYDERLAALLRDPHECDRIVDAVLAVVRQ